MIKLTFSKLVLGLEALGVSRGRYAAKFQKQSWSIAHYRPWGRSTAQGVNFLPLAVYEDVRLQRVFALATETVESDELTQQTPRQSRT